MYGRSTQFLVRHDSHDIGTVPYSYSMCIISGLSIVLYVRLTVSSGTRPKAQQMKPVLSKLSSRVVVERLMYNLGKTCFLSSLYVYRFKMFSEPNVVSDDVDGNLLHFYRNISAI